MQNIADLNFKQNLQNVGFSHIQSHQWRRKGGGSRGWCPSMFSRVYAGGVRANPPFSADITSEDYARAIGLELGYIGLEYYLWLREAS